MPSGRVHEAINLSALGLGTAAYLAYQPQLGVAESTAIAFAAAYLWGTFLVTPDLDLAEQNVRAKGRWGVLGLFWVPYGWMFSHRGLSHTWLVGPLTRLLYMGAVGAVLYWIVLALAGYLGLEFDLRAQLKVPPQEVLIALGTGYYVSQWMHLIADGVAPDHGATLTGKRRRR
ncbi:MAG: metal-binding protein [Meiothermus sp.]|nr:metal-binding protein [Meiothermus sp.]